MKSIFCVTIAGSRDIPKYSDIAYFAKIDEILNQFKDQYILLINSGNARGADNVGLRYALKNNLIYDVYEADWHKYGKSAGMIRNTEMIVNTQYLIVIWDGSSVGTMDIIKKALSADIIVKRINPETLKISELIKANEQITEKFTGR